MYVVRVLHFLLYVHERRLQKYFEIGGLVLLSTFQNLQRFVVLLLDSIKRFLRHPSLTSKEIA